VVDNWGGGRPSDKPWGDTHMVQEVADGRIFIHHNGPESVHIFDPDGKFIESWGPEMKGTAHGMDLRKEGNEEFLYFAPTGMHKVMKTNLKGEKVFELGYPKDAKNAKGEPCYVDQKRIHPDVHRLRARRERRLLRHRRLRQQLRPPLQRQGRVHQHLRRQGQGRGELDCPHGIYCDTRDPANPTILVADRSNHRLQWFTMDGKFIKIGTDELRDPCHFDQQGGDILIPDLNGRVTIFDKDNKLVTTSATTPTPPSAATTACRRTAHRRRLLHAARRDLGPRGQHLRHRVAAVRPRDEAAEGVRYFVARVAPVLFPCIECTG
jgi:hypothetical protein